MRQVSRRRIDGVEDAAIRTRRKILISTQVPAVKNVLTRPREHVRRLIRGLRGLGREAWGVGKVLVPGVALGFVYSMFEVELETHLLTALAGGVVVIMAVKPLRSRAFRYLGQALADPGSDSSDPAELVAQWRRYGDQA